MLTYYEFLKLLEYKSGDNVEWNIKNNSQSIEWDVRDDNKIEAEIKKKFDEIGTDSRLATKYLNDIHDSVKKKSPLKKYIVVFAAMLSVYGGALDIATLKTVVGDDNAHLVKTNLEEYRNPYDIHLKDVLMDMGFFYKGNMDDFLKDLAFSESTDDWTSVRYNRDGEPVRIGKYQFGTIAMRDVGINIDMDEFAQDPSIWSENEQDDAMLQLLINNKRYMRNFMNYDGARIDGIKITVSGLLAASHLVGSDAVKDYLKSNGSKNAKDGNGTPVSSYMKKFGNYKIDI